MNRSKIKYLLAGIFVLVGMYLTNREQIKQPGVAYPVEIYQRTGEILIKEFGFGVPGMGFDYITTTNRIEIETDELFILRGHHLIDESMTPWKAKVLSPPGSKKAKLLEIESNGVVIFPNKLKTELEFDAGKHSLLKRKELL